MKQANHHKQHDDDSTLNIVILSIAFMVLVSYLAHHYSTTLYSGWATLFLPVAKAVKSLDSTWFGVGVTYLLNVRAEQAASLVSFIKTVPCSQWHPHLFWLMNVFLGKHLELIFFPLETYGVVVTFKLANSVGPVYQRFNNVRAYNNKVLKKDWVTKLDSDTCDESALTPFEFALKNNLITRLNKDRVFSADTKATHEVYLKELGRKYESIDSLMETEEGECYQTVVNYIPERYRDEVIRLATTSHIYNGTVIIALLHMARKFGVVPMIDLRGIKHKNRALWYAMLSLERQVSFVEGAGLLSQYQYEMYSIKREGGTSMLGGQVDDAVNGLMRALREEPLDASGSQGHDALAEFMKDEGYYAGN